MKILRVLFLPGMAAFGLLSIFCFTSCGATVAVRGNDVLVNTGVASTVDGMTAKVKTANGTTVQVSIVKSDSATVAGKALDTYALGKTLDSGVKSLESNNAKDVSGQKIAADKEVGLAKISAASKATEGKQGLAGKALDAGKDLPAPK